MRKLPLIILALAAIAIALLSYEKFIARRDISRMLNDTRLTASLKTALALNRHLKDAQIEVSANQGPSERKFTSSSREKSQTAYET